MVEKTESREQMTVSIEIELDSIDYIEKFRPNNASKNFSLDLGSGVHADINSVEEGLGFLDSISMSMLLTFSAGVGSGVVANLIYSTIGAGIKRITLDGRRVRPNKEELIRALQTAIELANALDDKSDTVK